MSDNKMEQFVAISSKKGADFSAPIRWFNLTKLNQTINPYLPVRASAASDGAAVLTAFLACLR